MRILGIETSCDETGIAIYDTEQGLLADALHSQIALHADYGGVVPELASRDHVRKTLPLIRQVLADADCTADDINGIAFTAGPGLVGALLVGCAIGRSLAWAWGVPAVEVHHMEGHLLAPLLENDAPAFPFVALLVSGGHTLLVAVKGVGEYEILGDTLDDAAGEAFDKTAKLLGTGLQLQRPEDLRRQHREPDTPQTRADIARAFQDALVDTLLIKCRRALKQTGMQRNRQLRDSLQANAEKEGFRVFYPRPAFCTDNGAMIAFAGALRLSAGERVDLAFNGRPRWPIDTLNTPAPPG